MSRVETHVIGFDDRLGSKEPGKRVDGPATLPERIWILGKHVRHAVIAAYGDEVLRRESENGSRRHGITFFGNLIVNSKDFPGIQGINTFKDAVKSVVKSPEPSHLMVVFNHPELLRSGSRHPLWPAGALSAMGEILGEDPHLFIQNKYVRAVKRWGNFLPVRGSNGNGEILEASRRVLRRETPQVLAIFPEGTSLEGESMVKAHSGGALTPIETAVKDNLPLNVLPVALEQILSSRGETAGDDIYIMYTADPRSAHDLLPADYQWGKVEARRAVMDEIMTDVAEMLPRPKRGVYENLVDERSKARSISSRAPQVVYQKA